MKPRHEAGENGNYRKEPLRTSRRSIYLAILFAAGLYILIASFSVIAPILLAFILILLFTLALNPLVIRLRGLSGGRTFATGLVVLLFFSIAGLTGWAFFQPIQRSTAKFIERMPQYWERIQRPILKMEQKAVNSEQRIKREVKTEVAQEDQAKTNAVVVEPPVVLEAEATSSPPTRGIIHTGAGAILGGVSGAFKGLASNAASLILTVVTVFFGVIFTLLQPRPVVRMIFGLVPERHHGLSMNIARRIVEFIPRWALATLTGMGIIGLMIFLAMWPLLGFQDAVVLGLIALVFEAIPYAGPILASVPALLIATGEGGWTPLWVLLAYITVQALENNLIMPVVVGGQLKLHPVAVIFSMLLSVAIFGVLGVFIAMPMVAIVTILHQEIYRPKFLPNVSEADLEQLARCALESADSASLPRRKRSRLPKRNSRSDPEEVLDAME